MIKGRCKKEIRGQGQWGSFHYHQCNNSAKKDGYCELHHPDTEKKRQQKSEDRWNEKTRKLKRIEEGKKRSYAKSFIEVATLEELIEHKDLINERILEFSKFKD